MDISEKIGRIRDYYRSQFSTSDLRKVIGLRDFQSREFAFQLPDTSFVRNISFENPSRFIKHLQESAPFAAYVGAVYDQPPRKDYRIQDAKWKYRELVFDIDLNDYDDVRTCGCKGKGQICQECWPLLQPIVLFLDETFERDFDYKITWAFSGNRGLHAWIKGPDTDELSRKQRRAIVDYVTLVRQGRLLLLRAGDRRRKLPPYFQERVLRLVLTTALNLASKEELDQAGFKRGKIKEIIAEREVSGRLNYAKAQALMGSLLANTDQIKRALLEKWYPRFDENVTTDTRRVLRIPGSIHGTTGKQCRILKEEELIPRLEFDPLTEPSIYE
ncbi:MAG: DNA primase catalytic subunit PriS [Candidatus Hodarchaeales archaeon]